MLSLPPAETDRLDRSYKKGVRHFYGIWPRQLEPHQRSQRK
jgi:hypothetical protein